METVMSETELLHYVLNELKEIRKDIESLKLDHVALATKFSGLVAVISTVVSIIVSAAVYAVRRMFE